MSYTSPITTLPQMLRQPIGIAILASLGIHGLLWATLPSLPPLSPPEADKQQRTVGLVELTPAEQNRLPQANTSQVTLPPFAMQPSVLPPMPPPLPSGLLNSPGFSFPLGEKPLYNYPLKSLKSQTLPLTIQQSPRIKQLVPPSKPIKQPSLKLDKRVQFQPYSRPLSDNLQGIPPGSMSGVIPPDTPSIPSPSPSTSPSTSPGPSNSGPPNTSLAHAADNLYRANASTDSNFKGWKPPIDIRKPKYPQEACSSKLEGLAGTTVKVSSTGQISEPQLANLTGSQILNQAALSETRQYIADLNMAFKPDYGYTFRINYKYNSAICSANRK